MSIFEKVARNAPCPCGSGKKFKHCHGSLVATPNLSIHPALAKDGSKIVVVTTTVAGYSKDAPLTLEQAVELGCGVLKLVAADAEGAMLVAAGVNELLSEVNQ